MLVCVCACARACVRVCVCMCKCVRACVRAYACVCVCVCVFGGVGCVHVRVLASTDSRKKEGKGRSPRDRSTPKLVITGQQLLSCRHQSKLGCVLS